MRLELIAHHFTEHSLARRELALLTRLVVALEKFQSPEVPAALSEAIKEAAAAAEALKQAQEPQGA